MSQKSVSVSKLTKLLDLKVFTQELDLKKHKITLSDVNRPALQLSGFFEYFEPNRVQIIGMVEISFLKQMERNRRLEIYNQLLECEIPCIIFSRDFEPDEDFLRIAEEKDVPLLGTDKKTSSFMA
ncbi:MAG: HPr(Ser) kinase/phosphatase, partial [Lachnospiraceae bacterium]